ANPPVGYNWFKRTSSVGKGETYTIKKISSVDSGENKCRSSNEHGEKLSEALTLNVLCESVLYISVSISPTGEIVEGSSVTLTCSSDANPPVQNYTWFKATSLCNFDVHQQFSISVSISPSGEIVEGSSVTLTCSSDANPPVQNYTWFKEGGSSPVGSGHSYRAPQRGSYYCEAQNEHGSQKSAAKSAAMTVNEIDLYWSFWRHLVFCPCLSAEQAMTLYVVVGVGLCGAAVFITIILLIW
uniref:Ig-like domain-containing protein n=1 Tax=Pygocentrus nattereri TaxID=42514 RepID=A0AAR2JWW6_PYGNA